MSKLKKIFFYLAIVGWCLSLIVHIYSIAGVNLEDEYPYVFLLHLGVFIVWAPAMVISVKNSGVKPFEFNFELMNPITFFKKMFGHAPLWLGIAAIACFIYAFVNGLLSFGFLSAISDILSTNETNVTRIFSGHWLALYGLASGVLYPYKKEKTADDEYIKNY
jgi:flagellar biosynthesis protein FlhB